MIEELTKRLDQQQEYINERLKVRDRLLMQSLDEKMEAQRQIAAAEEKKGFLVNYLENRKGGSFNNVKNDLNSLIKEITKVPKLKIDFKSTFSDVGKIPHIEIPEPLVKNIDVLGQTLAAHSDKIAEIDWKGFITNDEDVKQTHEMVKNGKASEIIDKEFKENKDPNKISYYVKKIIFNGFIIFMSFLCKFQ